MDRQKDGQADRWTDGQKDGCTFYPLSDIFGNFELEPQISSTAYKFYRYLWMDRWKDGRINGQTG